MWWAEDSYTEQNDAEAPYDIDYMAALMRGQLKPCGIALNRHKSQLPFSQGTGLESPITEARHTLRQIGRSPPEKDNMREVSHVERDAEQYKYFV